MNKYSQLIIKKIMIQFSNFNLKLNRLTRNCWYMLNNVKIRWLWFNYNHIKIINLFWTSNFKSFWLILYVLKMMNFNNFFINNMWLRNRVPTRLNFITFNRLKSCCSLAKSKIEILIQSWLGSSIKTQILNKEMYL